MTTTTKIRCRGTAICRACGHACRKTTTSRAAFCACCEARLTERERETLYFFGDWHRAPWARAIARRLGTIGAWHRYVAELTSVLSAAREGDDL